jgi:glycosyltransferase involved in cell wall biosynthesis
MLKGYQHDIGRALFGLRSLAMIADRLRDYRIVVYCAQQAVRTAVELFSMDTGIQTLVLPAVSYEEMLCQYGSARLSIGINLSDGVPNSMLEAMLMGAFPIESEGSCANEWIRHGATGFIVPPEDAEAIARAVAVALEDDELVDRAAIVNRGLIEERMADSQIRKRAIRMYEETASASL